MITLNRWLVLDPVIWTVSVAADDLAAGVMKSQSEEWRLCLWKYKLPGPHHISHCPQTSIGMNIQQDLKVSHHKGCACKKKSFLPFILLIMKNIVHTSFCGLCDILEYMFSVLNLWVYFRKLFFCCKILCKITWTCMVIKQILPTYNHFSTLVYSSISLIWHQRISGTMHSPVSS